MKIHFHPMETGKEADETTKREEVPMKTSPLIKCWGEAYRFV